MSLALTGAIEDLKVWDLPNPPAGWARVSQKKETLRGLFKVEGRGAMLV